MEERKKRVWSRMFEEWKNWSYGVYYKFVLVLLFKELFGIPIKRSIHIIHSRSLVHIREVNTLSQKFKTIIKLIILIRIKEVAIRGMVVLIKIFSYILIGWITVFKDILPSIISINTNNYVLVISILGCFLVMLERICSKLKEYIESLNLHIKNNKNIRWKLEMKNIDNKYIQIQFIYTYNDKVIVNFRNVNIYILT